MRKVICICDKGHNRIYSDSVILVWKNKIFVPVVRGIWERCIKNS